MANSVDPVQAASFEQSDLGLHCKAFPWLGGCYCFGDMTLRQIRYCFQCQSLTGFCLSKLSGNDLIICCQKGVMERGFALLKLFNYFSF